MSAQIDAIANYLTTEGIANATWPIAKLRELGAPTASSGVIAIIETSGPAPEQASDRAYWDPTYQIIVRGIQDDPKSASEKAHQILRALNRSQIVGFVYFLATQSAPLAIGPDQNARYRFSINFRGAET